MEYKPTQCISTGQNQGDMRFIIEQSGFSIIDSNWIESIYCK